MFTRLAKLHAKQNFALAIILGDLFGDNSHESQLDEVLALVSGHIAVPLPTYFTVGSHALPARVIEKLEADDEVCPNLYFLGKRGTLKTSEGIRIVALGGNLGSTAEKAPESCPPKYSAQYHESDARALFGARYADILITHQWPRGIRNGSKVSIPDNVQAPDGMPCVAELCSTLKPRYHFSSETPFFYEREPFFHLPTEETPDSKHITRFINLAPYSKISKEKWLYAFVLDPKAPLPTTLPDGTTGTPLASVAKKRPTGSEGFSRFARDDSYQGRSTKRPRKLPPRPQECFFCLSNPNIATHLITSIGTESYMTTAKGPLSLPSTFPALGFPGHMLIIPFSHAPTFESIPDQESRQATIEEMNKYRHALSHMIQDRSHGELGAVTWEVSRWNGVHIHWQFLPVPSLLVKRGLVEAAFIVEAENLKYPKFDRKPTEHVGAEQGDYFRVLIWSPLDGDSDGKERPETSTLILALSPDFRFDIQFGRRVMAKLLQLEDRMSWKDGVQTEEEEKNDAEAFKKAFEKFDFSLE